MRGWFFPPVSLLSGLVLITPMGLIPVLHGMEQLQQKASIKSTQFNSRASGWLRTQKTGHRRKRKQMITLNLIRRIQRTPDKLFLFSFPQSIFSNRNFKKPGLVEVASILNYSYQPNEPKTRHRYRASSHYLMCLSIEYSITKFSVLEELFSFWRKTTRYRGFLLIL